MSNAPVEVCGNLASIICYSCRVDKIREAREKKISLGKHRYIKEVEKQAPSLMDARDKNRVGFCLCILCDKEIHSIAHRLGVSTLQEFQYQDDRSDAVVKQCNSCKDTQRFDSAFYSTDGPVQTLVSSEHGKTIPAIKQLFICQRCYELSMFPPMTNKNMYHELKESKHFTDILNQSLKRELIAYEKDLLAGFASKKKDLARYIEKIEREVHHLESGVTVTRFNPIAGGKRTTRFNWNKNRKTWPI